MRNFIVVSRCMKINKIAQNQIIINFHFKGFLDGKQITGLNLECRQAQSYKEGEDYIMYVEMIHYKRKIVWGKILKAKKIHDIKR